MTDPPSSTMASSEAATPSRANQTARTAPTNLPTTSVTKNFVTRDFDMVLRAFFPTPTAPAKFNPITAMTQLFRTLLKDETSLVLRTANNDDQIILASAQLPTGEKGFKKFFKVSTTRVEKQNQTHVCIGCHVLSNRSLSNIKFKSTDNHFLAWLKKERIFVESDSLGIERPVTIGYFTKIVSELTHLVNFRNHLVNQLMLVEIEADTAVDLAPHLKTAQLEAMTNGDEFIPVLPNFEVYRTRLTHGRAPSQVISEVLGVKCHPKDAKLLGEFFTKMASETTNDQRDGIFLPKGAAYLLGPKTYEQVLQENNFFQSTVATIPVNLAYDAWFAVIDPDNTSDTDTISIYDNLIRQPWFLRVESVARKKCLIVVTKSNLPEARAWIDSNLEPMVRKSIPQGIDPPPSYLPRRLDKPIYTATSQSYADILKKQFSRTSNVTPTTTANSQPPRKRHASIIDYDSDHSAAFPTLPAAVSNSVNNRCASTSQPATIINADFATELTSLKNEILSLKNIIATAVEQLKAAIVSFQPTKRTTESNDMDTDVDHSKDLHTPPENPIDLPALIQDLKKDIANIVHETRTIFNQPLTSLLNDDNLSSIT